MDDKACIEAAEEFLLLYREATRLPRDVALRIVMVDDAGRNVKRGIKLLREQSSKKQ